MQGISEYMTHENMSAASGDEFAWVMSKSRRWFMTYLADMADDCFHEDRIKKQILRIVGDSFKEKMTTDRRFYRKVEDFVTKRRTAGEKTRFCNKLANEIFAEIDLKALHYERYRNEYED